MEMENGNGKKKMMIHTRFGPPVKDAFVEWIKANSSKYIVAQEKGTLLENTHYHACYEVSVGVDSIRKKLCEMSKALGLTVAKGKANAYYGAVKECTDESYVVKEGNIIEVSGYDNVQALIDEGKRKFIRPVSGAAAPVTPRAQVVVVQRSRMTIAEKFIAHCETVLGWRRDNTFGLDNYEQAKKKVTREMVGFLRGKFNDPQGVVIARNCLYEFANEDLKDYLQDHYPDKIKMFL